MLDGRIEEEEWARSSPIPLPFEIDPGNNIPARARTDCRLSYDKNNLYFACDASDPFPENVRAFITDRDHLEGHDRIMLVLDPFNDSQRGLAFLVNPLGVQADGKIDEQASERFDESWDAIWDSAGRKTSNGYSVEGSIPFKSLRFPDTSGPQTWRFYFTQYWPRSENIEMRSSMWDRNNPCQLCQAETITGIKDVSPGRNLELRPSMTSGRTDIREYFPDGELAVGRVRTELGLDLRWNPIPNLSVSTTINPDFSQVQADVAQLDVNNTFALRFPEKRAFFLEGADLYESPHDAVFTRTINDPSVGINVSGRFGVSAFGIIGARDESTNIIVPGRTGSQHYQLEGSSNALIGRFRFDLPKNSSIGVITTHRSKGDYHNNLIAIDGFFRPVPRVTGSIQVLRSETAYPDELAADLLQSSSSFSGTAVEAEINYHSRNFDAEIFYETADDDFRADAGSVDQVGVTHLRVEMNPVIWGKPGSWLTRINFWLAWWEGWDRDGNGMDEYRVASFTYRGPLQSRLSMSYLNMQDFFAGRTFKGDRININAAIEPVGWFTARTQVIFGEAIDFANVRLADFLRITPGGTLRLGARTEISFSHTYNHMRDARQKIFTANLSELRLVYNFNVRTFVRAIVQYRHTSRNPDAYASTVERTTESVFGQFLFSYKLNPQSVLFIGYTDNRNGSTGADFQMVPFTQIDRSVFLKIGYAWRP